MNRLHFGVFVQILYPYVMHNLKADEKIENEADFIQLLLDSSDNKGKTVGRIAPPTASRYKAGTRAIPKNIATQFYRSGKRDVVIENMDDGIVPYIDRARKQQLIDDLVSAVERGRSIDDDFKTAVLKEANIGHLADFLADILIYSVGVNPNEPDRERPIGSMEVDTEDALRNKDSELTRTEKISNVGESDGLFIGREDLLNALEDGFKEGYHIQFIGGGNGWGKSRVALEYAQRHAAEYQIICWINASDENCIISSIVNFFNLAKVPYDDALSGGMAELFCRFFEENRGWLIVFDNADLSLSHQQAMLKKYMPSQEGHIIVTGNFGETAGMGHHKYYLLDRLNAEPSGSLLSPELSDLCNGQPLPMTLISSYIRESSWVDAGTYLHMLEDRGVGKENGPVSHIDEAAFEIKIWTLLNQQRYFNNKIAVAVRQFLLISAICSPVDLDLPFLSAIFPIFPDPLDEVCFDKKLRKQLIEKLKGFGFYEIRDGVIHGNSWLTELSQGFFLAVEKNGICTFMLDRMEKSIIAIRENQYLGNTDELVALVKPYIDQTLRYMHRFGGLTDDLAAQKYPNLRAVAFISASVN